MNKVHLKGRTYLVPGSWGELSAAQLVRLAHVVFTPASEGELRARVVATLLSLYTWRTIPRTVRFQLLTGEAEHDALAPLASFVVSGPVQLSRQLLPRVRPTWYGPTWYGPGDRLAGVTFTEWIDAESALFAYRQSQQVQHLDRLVAVLYRPGHRRPDARGDHRQPYHQHQLEARARVAGRLPLDVRRAVLLYYDSCRRLLLDAYPEVFGLDGEGGGSGGGSSSGPGPAYLRVMRELAGSPDKFEVIGQQPIGNILYDVSERVKEIRDHKNEAAKNRSRP